MNGIENTKKEMPILKNDERLYVYLQGNHFQQNNVLTSSNDHVINKNVVNIYIVYKLDPLASTRDKVLLYKMLYLELCKLLKMLLITVCFYHVTYAFQSESTLYSCLNVKELLARSRREI